MRLSLVGWTFALDSKHALSKFVNVGPGAP